MIIDEEFFAWRRVAERLGLGHAAMERYYEDDSDRLFTVCINGDTQTFPVFTTPEWMTPHADPDDILTSLEDTPYQQHDEQGIYLRTAAQAYLNDDPNPSPEDYVWNGDMLFARVGPHAGTATPVESDFYTKLSIEGPFLDELYRAIYRRAPNATPTIVPDIVSDLKLPARERHAKTFDRMLASPLSAGSTLLVVVNTGDGYRALFAKRAGTMLESPGWWSLAPSGSFETQDGDELSLTRQHLRAYSEEFFDNSHRIRPLDCPELDALRDLLESGDAALDHLGMSIECRRAHLEFNGLLFIDDPDYYDKYINGNLQPGEEHDRFEFIPLSEGERLGRCITSIKPYHAPCAVLGLHRLQDEYGVSVSADLDIRGP